MSISHNVIAQRAEDPLFLKHMTVFRACRDAEVELPAETAKYLGEGADYVDEHAARVAALSIPVDDLTVTISKDGHTDYVVDLSKLPKGVRELVFRVSW